MVRSHWSWRLSVAALVVLVAGVSVSWSQAKKPKDKDKDKKEPSPAVVRTLESQAEKAKTEYVNGLIEVAKGFEDQGLTEKTKETLKSILTVVPDFENRLGIGSRSLKKRSTRRTPSRSKSMPPRVDACRGWSHPRQTAAAGRGRVAPSHSERADRSRWHGEPGPGQWSGQRDPSRCPVGVVRDPRANPKDQKIEPFLIGSEKEIAPRNDGILFLKVNLPANSQSKGKYRVQVSGNFVKLQGQ